MLPGLVPDIVREVEVLDRAPKSAEHGADEDARRPRGARQGVQPVVAIVVEPPGTVKLTRVTDHPTNQEFNATWELRPAGSTRVALQIDAKLACPVHPRRRDRRAIAEGSSPPRAGRWLPRRSRPPPPVAWSTPANCRRAPVRDRTASRHWPQSYQVDEQPTLDEQRAIPRRCFTHESRDAPPRRAMTGALVGDRCGERLPNRQVLIEDHLADLDQQQIEDDHPDEDPCRHVEMPARA